VFHHLCCDYDVEARRPELAQKGASVTDHVDPWAGLDVDADIITGAKLLERTSNRTVDIKRADFEDSLLSDGLSGER